MTDIIEYRTDDIPAGEELSALYESARLAEGMAPDELHRAVEQSGWVATAWHGGRLVGLARVLTDGVYVAYLQEMLVHPDYQHQGVGKELLDRYDQSFGTFQNQVTVTDADWAKHKLSKRGFRAEPAAMSRKRPLAAWGSG